MSRARAVTAPLDDPREATPPRMRWLRRVIVALLATWVALASIWLILLGVATRKLNAELRGARERGESVDLADFMTPAVAPDENAAAYLRRAIEQFRENEQESRDNWEMLHDYPLSAEAVALLRPHLRANEPVLAELRAMRQFSSADWRLIDPADSQLELERKVWDHLFTLGKQRDVAQFLSQASMVAHYDADTTAAIEYLRDMLAIARTGAEAPTMVASLVAVGIESMAVSAVADLAPRLMMTDPAARAAVQALTAELLEEDQRSARARRAMLAERAWTVSFVDGRLLTYEYATSLTIVPVPRHQRVLDALSRPLRRMRAVNHIVVRGRAGEALLRPDWPAASALMPPRAPVLSSSVPLVEWLDWNAGGRWNVMIEYDFRTVAMRRMAAIMLALRLYEIDHGRLPPTLQELVGPYLSALPADPYASDGRAIGYGRAGATVFLYSVSLNGVPDLAIAPTAEDHNRFDCPDYVLMYDRRKIAATAPAAR